VTCVIKHSFNRAELPTCTSLTHIKCLYILSYACVQYTSVSVSKIRTELKYNWSGVTNYRLEIMANCRSGQVQLNVHEQD